MCYVDQKEESFYTVSWACNVDGIPFLVAGGINGIIRVIDVSNEKLHKVEIVILSILAWEVLLGSFCSHLKIVVYRKWGTEQWWLYIYIFHSLKYL